MHHSAINKDLLIQVLQKENSQLKEALRNIGRQAAEYRLAYEKIQPMIEESKNLGEQLKTAYEGKIQTMEQRLEAQQQEIEEITDQLKALSGQ